MGEPVEWTIAVLHLHGEPEPEPEPPLTFSGSWRVMEPDEKLEITLQDGTVLHGRVIDASSPSDDGSVTYTVSWEAGE